MVDISKVKWTNLPIPTYWYYIIARSFRFLFGNYLTNVDNANAPMALGIHIAKYKFANVYKLRAISPNLMLTIVTINSSTCTWWSHT